MMIILYIFVHFIKLYETGVFFLHISSKVITFENPQMRKYNVFQDSSDRQYYTDKKNSTKKPNYMITIIQSIRKSRHLC